MPSQSRKYRTQWTSTFFAAGELTRRGYLVTITHGNARFVDLLVQSPSGESFSIDVKGMSARNWIPVGKPYEENGSYHSGQYYILVYSIQNQKNSEFPRYFIMSLREMCEEIMKGEEEFAQANREKLKKSEAKLNGWTKKGIAFKQAERYENRWNILPGYELMKQSLNHR
jgi:hypothetical protein